MKIKNVETIAQLVVKNFDRWEEYGNVNVVKKDNLNLFCYNQQAFFDNRWNIFEKLSRGLIISDSGEIVARPFVKFFNNGDEHIPSLEGVSIKEITNKLDGSLGILYRHQGSYKIATKGSFDSEQAQKGTELLKNYDLSSLSDDLTLLFEIIYPENRIVVDYQQESDLRLVGAVNRKTGEDFFYEDWKKLAKRFGFKYAKKRRFQSLDSVLEHAKNNDDLEEGWVVRYENGIRVKIKTDVYRLAHSFKSVLANPTKLYRAMVSDIRINLPDSLETVLAPLWGRCDVVLRDARQNIDQKIETIIKELPSERREQAKFLKEKYPNFMSAVFAKIDKKKNQRADKLVEQEFVRLYKKTGMQT